MLHYLAAESEREVVHLLADAVFHDNRPVIILRNCAISEGFCLSDMKVLNIRAAALCKHLLFAWFLEIVEALLPLILHNIFSSY